MGTELDDPMISELARHLSPVVVARPAGTWAASWMLAALALVLIPFALLLGFRPSLGVDLHSSSFLLKQAALLLISCTSIYLAFRLSLPGRKPASRALALAPPALGAAYFALLGWDALTRDEAWLAADRSAGTICMVCVLAASALPSLLSVLLLRRLAPLQPTQVAGWLGIASGSLSALGIGLHCASNSPVHCALLHGFPVLGVALLTTLLATRALRW